MVAPLGPSGSITGAPSGDTPRPIEFRDGRVTVTGAKDKPNNISVSDDGPDHVRFRVGEAQQRIARKDITAGVDIHGGSKKDRIDVGTHVPGLRIHGGGGGDHITSRARGATISTGDGGSTVDAHGAGTTVTGGAGRDRITVHGDDSYVDARGGDDEVVAHGKRAKLLGGAGNDTLVSSGAGAMLRGGAGNDRFFSSGADSHIDGGAGTDHIKALGPRSTVTDPQRRIWMDGTAGGGDPAYAGPRLPGPRSTVADWTRGMDAREAHGMTRAMAEFHPNPGVRDYARSIAPPVDPRGATSALRGAIGDSPQARALADAATHIYDSALTDPATLRRIGAPGADGIAARVEVAAALRDAGFTLLGDPRVGRDGRARYDVQNRDGRKLSMVFGPDGRYSISGLSASVSPSRLGGGTLDRALDARPLTVPLRLDGRIGDTTHSLDAGSMRTYDRWLRGALPYDGRRIADQLRRGSSGGRVVFL